MKMTEYTPTTEQVRNAYVRGMRDTFIASAGEHYEEFDRWMQAHDEEVRASVQPPTREQIAEAIYTMRAGSKQNWHKAAFRDDYLKEADAVLALFPQPNPSEVEVEGSFFAVADLPDVLARHMRALDDALRREKQHWIDQHEQPLTPDQRRARMCPCTLEPVPPAEPVSIADMAPGTTFTARQFGGHWLRLVRVVGGVATTDEPHVLVADIDPSTVRDVTPPAATPEEGDR